MASSSSKRYPANEEASHPSLCSMENDRQDFSGLRPDDDEKEHLRNRCDMSRSGPFEEFGNNDDQMDEQTQRHEAKITELQSIIAELSKKLDGQRINVIREEDEDSNCSVDSNSRDSSNNNNPNESCTDNEDVTVDVSHMMISHDSPRRQRKSVRHHNAKSCMQAKTCEESSSRAYKDNQEIEIPSTHILQLADLKEEVLLLRTENEAVHKQVSHQEAELNKTRAALGSLREERDRLRRKVRELHTKLQNLQSQGSQGSQTGSPTRSRGSNVNSATGECSPTHREDAPIAKIAERVKLKRVGSGDRHISGSEISSLGVSSAKVVEHLVQHMQEESNAQEIFHALCSSGSHISESKIREFEVETERLNSKIEHLKSQNDLLCLTLEESKTQCDRLSVLIGKYESNNTALQLALSYSDQALEVTELLLRLMESEIGLIVAKCHVAGTTTLVHNSYEAVDERDESTAMLKRAQESRKAIEALAKRYLHKLDRNCRIACSLPNFADRPWEDLSSHSHTASTTSSSSSYDGDLTKMDENKLRDFVLQMKNERALVRMTVTELESVHIDPAMREPSTSSDIQKLDLENAVLIQELMAMKEEKAELKAQVYLLEKDSAALELKLNGREVQEQAYIAHIEQLKCEVREQEHASGKYKCEAEKSPWDWDQAQCLEQSADLSQSLVEALHREKKLKSRIQELVAALEKVNRNSDLRHQQSAEFVNDLKRANSALITAFEKSKRKYQSKIKKLEQQMLTLSERHAAQVRVLQQRISLLGDQVANNSIQTASETSL